MDMTVRTKNLPKPGHVKTDDGGMSFAPGGAGASAAAVFSKLDAEGFLLARLGNDAHGKRLLKLYEDMGMDSRLLLTDEDTPTCQSAVIREEGKDDRRIIFPGASEHLGIHHIEDAFSLRPNALYMTLELPSELLASAAQMAADLSLPIYVDGGPILPDTDLSNFPHVTVFSPNENETFALTGIRPGGTDSCLMAAIELQKLISADYYIIKLGDRGAFIYDGIYCHSVAAYVFPVTDATGAGAAFTAALCLNHLQNGDILSAARYANAVAALTMQKTGSFTAFPVKAEVDAFLQKHTRG